MYILAFLGGIFLGGIFARYYLNRKWDRVDESIGDPKNLVGYEHFRDLVSHYEKTYESSRGLPKSLFGVLEWKELKSYMNYAESLVQKELGKEISGLAYFFGRYEDHTKPADRLDHKGYPTIVLVPTVIKDDWHVPAFYYERYMQEKSSDTLRTEKGSNVKHLANFSAAAISAAENITRMRPPH